MGWDRMVWDGVRWDRILIRMRLTRDLSGDSSTKWTNQKKCTALGSGSFGIWIDHQLRSAIRTGIDDLWARVFGGNIREHTPYDRHMSYFCFFVFFLSLFEFLLFFLYLLLFHISSSFIIIFFRVCASSSINCLLFCTSFRSCLPNTSSYCSMCEQV